MATGLHSRRNFLVRAGSFAAAWPLRLRAQPPGAGPLPNPVGYATIAWPKAQFSQALETISALGFQGVQFLGWVRDAYAGSKLNELKDRLGMLKLRPVVLSCSGVKLNPRQADDETGAVRSYADFFHRLGGLYLQVTDGGRPGIDYSSGEIKALGMRMDALGKVAQEFGLALGYHPHLGTLGETREGLGRILDATDPEAVKLIADVAHLTLGGSDPAEVIRTYRDRLVFTHFKDVRKDAANLAKQDLSLARKAKYHFCELGAGVVDFSAVVRVFREISFRGWVVIELDGYELPSGGPAESARRNKKAAEKLGLKV